MKGIVIRKANFSDMDSINNLNFEMHNYLAGLLGKKLSKRSLRNEKVSKQELKKENYYVAVENERVIGFIVFGKIEEDEWYGRHIYVYEIAVSKNSRGKGIGTKLFNIALDYAKKNKLNIKVDTLIKNEKAIKFYKKLGFMPLSLDLILERNIY